MPLLDDAKARMAAILAGTYPSPTPYITASTFVDTATMLPHQNPRWPAGTLSAATNRRYDIEWTGVENDPPGVANALEGPWQIAAAFTLRVQYALALPNALAPTGKELALGALEIATRRAQNDLAVIEWAFLQLLAWDTVAIGYVRRGPRTAAKADELRVVGTIQGALLLSQSAASSPGLWTP